MIEWHGCRLSVQCHRSDFMSVVGPMVCRRWWHVGCRLDGMMVVGSIPPRLNAMSAIGPMPCRLHDVPVIAPIAWLLSIQCHGGRVLSRLSVHHVGCRSSAISVIGPVQCRLSVQYHVGCRSDATGVRVGCRSSAISVQYHGLAVESLSAQCHLGCRSTMSVEWAI